MPLFKSDFENERARVLLQNLSDMVYHYRMFIQASEAGRAQAAIEVLAKELTGVELERLT